MRSLYKFYGAAVVGWLLYALLYGWSWAEVDQIKKVPKSVRDNPGSYRSHYTSYHHYMGGK